MRKSRTLPPLALAATLLPAAATLAQTTPVEVELGYRWVNVSGNEPAYRTQVNDRPGLLLRSLSFDSAGPAGFLDHLRVDASDLGAGPAGALRVSASRVDAFRLSFTWRRTELYSALPAFANPFLADGVVPGQHTYDRTRDIYDATLEIFPGKAITPILGYTRNLYSGPGRTTYFLGQDEFALGEDLRARDEEYRVGVGFHTGPVEGAVIQGWRRYRLFETATLLPGAGAGNSAAPVLGQDVSATGITRKTESRVNTPVTSAWVAGRLLGRVRLVGSYVRADASADASLLENGAGSFVSFQIARFFSGLTDTIRSNANADSWRGSARAEVNLAPNLDFSGGWTERRRTLQGGALVSSLYVDAVTYAGVSVGDLLRVIRAETALERDDRTYDASVTARLFPPFSANAGWSQTQQDVRVTPDASEIVLPGGQGGRFGRTLNTYGGGVTFSKAGITAGADYRRDEADRPILRSDFVSRDRYKFRGAWSYRDLFRVGGTWQETRASDDAPEIGYDTKVREITGDLEVNLFDRALTLRGSAGEFQADRRIQVRVPQDFTIAPSVQKEIGHTWEGGVTASWKRFTLDGGYLWFENGGSIPFTLDRARLRAEVFVRQDLGIAGEWLRDRYRERIAFDQAGPLSDYSANRYGVFLHWRP